MVVNDNAGRLIPRGVWATIASNRASTGCSYTPVLYPAKISPLGPLRYNAR